MSSNFLFAIFAIAAVLGVVALLLVHVFKPKKRGISRSNFMALWKEIEVVARRGEPSDYKHAIVDADKLLDLVLKSRVRGDNLGSRLKNAKSLFKKNIYNDAWEVHKVRNKLVHEVGFGVSRESGKKIINDYRRIFRELGY